MDFSDVVRKRRMVRSYETGRAVPRPLIDSLLALAVRAPSAGNTQGWQFVVLDTPQSLSRFWDATTTPEWTPDSWLRGMQTAPVLVLCVSDKDAYLDRYAEPDKGWTDRSESHWPMPYWHIDTGMAAMILLLAATDRGLGSCFFGIDPAVRDAVHSEFDLAASLQVVGVISLGYPAPDRKSPSLRRGRRPIESVTRYA